jgi:hypothetical protein
MKIIIEGLQFKGHCRSSNTLIFLTKVEDWYIEIDMTCIVHGSKRINFKQKFLNPTETRIFYRQRPFFIKEGAKDTIFYYKRFMVNSDILKTTLLQSSFPIPSQLDLCKI